MIQTLDSQISEGKGRSTTSMISKLFKYFSKESTFLNVPGILHFPKFYKIIIDSLQPRMQKFPSNILHNLPRRIPIINN